jgi:phosphoenolpyruvate---glycerone phosphotransferase subunit DhaL
METMNQNAFIAMLKGAIEQIRAHHEELSKLDSYGGDGDHGTTILRAMEKMNDAIESGADKDCKSLLTDIAWALMGVDGGATGPLFGSFFLGMSDAASSTFEMSSKELALLFASGLAMVQKQTMAKIGDKTIMDALIPAVEAGINASENGANVFEMLQQAAHAAQQGAESTQQLKTRFGRAKNAGDSNLGHADPGATSVSYIYKGFVEGIQ